MLARLLERAVAYGNDHAPDSAAARLALVVLAGMELAPLLLPVSKDPRLERVMQRLIRKPGLDAPLEDLAARSGASPRTLARLFQSETGMTFVQWRTRLRLVESIERRPGQPSEALRDLRAPEPPGFVGASRSGTPRARGPS